MPRSRRRGCAPKESAKDEPVRRGQEHVGAGSRPCIVRRDRHDPSNLNREHAGLATLPAQRAPHERRALVGLKNSVEKEEWSLPVDGLVKEPRKFMILLFGHPRDNRLRRAATGVGETFADPIPGTRSRHDKIVFVKVEYLRVIKIDYILESKERPRARVTQ